MTEAQHDAVYNAIAVGMAIEDAYMYAGLSPQETLEASEDPALQTELTRYTKQLEYSLLDNMRVASRTQVANGKHEATAWLLERLYPRYSQKAQGDIGRITLALSDAEGAQLKIVE
jgi:hypothetical protein